MGSSTLSRKLLAGSLSLFLLSPNLSFLWVVVEPVINTTYADYSTACNISSAVGTQCGGGTVYMNSGGIVSIAAPDDESGVLSWWSPGVTTATDFYDGYLNTETLSGTVGSAAWNCWNKVGSGGTMDWYLPSKHELLDMNAFSGVIGIFSASGSRYWSSTEFDSTDAYDVWFGGVNDWVYENTPKSGNYPVRCIRKLDFSNVSGQCGPANMGTFPVSNFINLTNFPHKCSDWTVQNMLETAAGWTWSCQGSGSGTNSSCSAFKTTFINSINVTKNIQATGSNTIELSFDEPIRLTGIDGSGWTFDDATGSIMTFGSGTPDIAINTGLSNSGKLVFDTTGLNIWQWYELTLNNIVSYNHGSWANTKQLPNGFKYPFVWWVMGNNSTRLVDSYPANHMANVPIGIANMELYFSNELSVATFTWSSIRLYEWTGEVLYTVTGSYNSITSPGGDLGGKISVTIPPGSLLAGKGYKLVVSRDVKDLNNASIDGPSGYGNDQEIFFSTLANFANVTGTWGNSSLYIASTNPFPGAFNIPRNSKLQVEFSDPIDSTGSNMAKIEVFMFTGVTDFIGSDITANFTKELDNNGKVLTLSGNGLLPANKKLELRARSDIRSVFWSFLGGDWGTSTGVVYTSAFTTATGIDTTSTQVQWTLPGSGSVNQSVDLRSIDIGFDKPLDFATVNVQTVQLSQNGTEEANLQVIYDIGTKTIHISTQEPLIANTTYQVNLIGGTGGIRTTTGNNLLGWDYIFSFTTGAAGTNPFVIERVEAYPTKIKVQFSHDVIATEATSADYSNSVLNPLNYTIRYATGVALSAVTNPATIFSWAQVVSLSGANLSYDTLSRELTIMNTSPALVHSSDPMSQNILGLMASWVTDTQGNILSSANGWDRFYGPVIWENLLNQAGGYNGTTSGNYNIYDFTPVSLFPDINIAGKTSRYHLSFPTSQILGSGSVIELTFPAGFDVSSVSKDGSSLFPNSNITGSGNFSFTVTSSVSNKVVLTITNNDSNLRTGQKTYINMDLAGIVNPLAPMEFGTDGYKVDVVTKTIGGSMILETLRSNAIFIQSAGAHTLTVQLKQSDGTTNLTVPNLLVRLNGSRIGMIEGFSDASGLVTFTGLDSGEYFIWADPIVLDSTYSQTIYLWNPVPSRLNIAWNQAVILKLFDTTTDMSLKTLSLNITGLPANEKVVVWASSPSGYFEKRFSANGAGSVIDSMKLRADEWQIGVRPDFGATAASSIINYVQPAWQSPQPTDIDMRSSGATYTQSINTANNVLTVTLTDGTDPIPGASIWAYSPGGQNMGAYGMTNTNGQVQLKLVDGSYTIGARAEGLPQIPENNIEVTGNISLSLVVKKPNLQIEGKILSWDTGIQNASVYAYRIESVTDSTPVWDYTNSMTDSNGSYELFVDEDTVWKVGVFVPGIGWLDERIVSVGSVSVTENFIASDIELFQVSGTVSNLPGNAFANIWAESTESDDYYGNFTTTAADGTYSLQLKSSKTYKLHAFVPELGEIDTLTTPSLLSDLPAQNFNAGASLHSLTVNIKTAWTGGVRTVVDEFLVDYINTTTKVGGTKKILSDSWVTLDLSPSIYRVRIAMPGSSRIASQTVDLSSSSGSLDFILENIPVTLSGTVRDQWGNVISEAVVEVFNTGGINLSTKTNAVGLYSLKVKGGTTYQIMTKKAGYIADSFTGVTVGSSSLGNLDLLLRNTATATDIITVSGSIYLGTTATGSLAKLNAKVWAQWYNADGTRNEKWTGTETDEHGRYALKLKKGLIWKLSSRSDGYEKIDSVTIGSWVTTSQPWRDIVLDIVAGYTIKSPVSTNVDPNNGWVLHDRKNKIKITLPIWSLDGSKESVTVLTKETSNVVDNGNSRPIGGSAKEITAIYTDGTAVTDFNSDIDIELSYSSGELLSALGSTGYTLENINNLLISYFDNASDSWRTIATTVLLYNSGGTLLANSDTIELLDSVTLRGKTNHLTLFTSLVSTVVTQSVAPTTPSPSPTPSGGGGWGGGSSVSLSTGLAATFNGISKYLGDTTQSIVLKSGTNINTVLSITRNGKTIALTDLLKSSANTLSSVGKNLVNFAVGDIISTSKEGSLEIALDGYSKMQLSPGSSMKIAEVGSNFLSYENIGGSVQYQFDKRDGGKFEYKVKWKTGYATIRGTTLEVISDSTKDSYKLIEGKIDIYNALLKKTVSLVAWDSYIAYANGTEDASKVSTPTKASLSTTPVVTKSTVNACGPFGDVLKTSEFCPYISKLNEKGIARTNATYEPNRSISRAELLKMASLSRWVTNIFNKTYTYSDINSADWWAPYVSTAKRLGYISATNTTFEPNRAITRAEAMKIIMNFSWIKVVFDAKYTYGDIQPTDWSAAYISTAKKSGFISATASNFRPNDAISRAEVAKILYNIFFK